MYILHLHECGQRCFVSVAAMEGESGRNDCDKYPFTDFLTSAGSLMLTHAAPLKRFIQKTKHAEACKTIIHELCSPYPSHLQRGGYSQPRLLRFSLALSPPPPQSICRKSWKAAQLQGQPSV